MVKPANQQKRGQHPRRNSPRGNEDCRERAFPGKLPKRPRQANKTLRRASSFVSQKRAWHPTHELAYDRGLWIPVILVGKRWMARDGECVGLEGDLTRPYRRRRADAPKPGAGEFGKRDIFAD